MVVVDTSLVSYVEINTQHEEKIRGQHVWIVDVLFTFFVSHPEIFYIIDINKVF